MNDIQLYNHKYSTVESLLNKTGKVNSSILRREWFNELDVVKKIYDESSELDVFGEVPIGDRISFIADKMKVEKCPFCGSGYICFPGTNRRYRNCRHKINADRKLLSKSRTKIWKVRKECLLSSLEDKNLVLKDDEFEKLVMEYFEKPENFNFSITDKSKDFFHDLILRTEKILPVEEHGLELSQRIYMAKNNLKELPKCPHCDRTTEFRNRKLGYSKTCHEHFHLYARDMRILNSISNLSSSIDAEKYEIVSLPETMSKDELTIRCRKCGRESSWVVKNGMLGEISEKRLCRHCEMNHSKGETDIFKFIKSIYGGEVVFKNGSRRIIPPYEIDIYLPEKKLAIEYDGIFWHCESNGKGRNYHLKKTEMCEEIGIQLIHVFENEWIEKQEIVKSRIKNLLGIYDTTVYARKCKVVDVDQKTAASFLDENHIQGRCNSKIRLGLESNGELVSIMTFSKPRFSRNGPEWELVRFCNKLGYHVPGGASKLLRHFEKLENPKSVLSYADRRWSMGKMYETLGFEAKSKSKPNYWYFKLSSNGQGLINRVSCQKHRLKSFLRQFDPKLSECENMRLNGYDRIFDCGNFVFVKKYEKDRT